MFLRQADGIGDRTEPREVHDTAEGGKLKAQVRTTLLATQLKAAFTEAGVAEGGA